MFTIKMIEVDTRGSVMPSQLETRPAEHETLESARITLQETSTDYLEREKVVDDTDCLVVRYENFDHYTTTMFYIEQD